MRRTADRKDRLSAVDSGELPIERIDYGGRDMIREDVRIGDGW